MKMIKAMKKLKFWSRKKKTKTKKKPIFTEQQQPSSSYSESSCHYYHHHHCHYYPVEPSAPPLPSWLDYNGTQGTTISGTDHFVSTTTTSAVAGSSQAPFTTEDECVPGLVLPSSQEEKINGKNTYYQQYMVENPVYGVPALPSQFRSERNAGAFGCVFSIGAHLLRCFFPCFHIREATK